MSFRWIFISRVSLAKSFIFIGVIFLLCINKSNGVKKAYYVDNDTRKVPIVHVEGVLGHRVELPCDITPKRRDDTVYMVLWFRESAGKPLYSFDVRGRGMKTAKTSSTKNGFDRRADFQAGSYPAHLLVSDLQLSDEGIYRCRVDYRYSPTRNALVNLTVVVPPSMPVIYDESGQEISSVLGPYVEGSDVRLSCRVHGGKPEPTVVWHVNGEVEDAIHHSDRYGNVINELLFRGLNRSHLNSQFSCKASNTRLIQPVVKAVVLDLNLKPLYVRMKQKQADKLVAGREYRLVCETAGSKPPAVLKWIKGGKEMVASTQDMDAGNVTQSTFMFIPTPKDNGASIVCRAENPWLNRSTTPYHILEETWTINVVYLPEVKLSLGSTLNPLEIKEGTDVYFECRILANPKITRLAWFFNDDELRHTPNAGIIMSNQSLVLQGITRKSAGNYTCIATNAEGSTPSNALLLNVQYSPVCHSEMGVTVGAAKGEHIGLRCSVDSSPTAQRFEWEFHGTGGDSVDVVPDGKIMSQGDLSRFLYTPSTDSEFGTFLCWASNDIGRQVQPCVFHVVPAVKPNALENCTIVNQTTTMIHIECSAQRQLPQIPDQPLFQIMHGGDLDNPHTNHDPAQYGLFPEYYVMEVWDLKNRSLRKNLSAEMPIFILKGLSPGSLLRLILYAANSHGKSDQHVIEAVVAGDAEKHVLGASTSKMEFFPLAAVGVGMAVVGTLLLLFLVMLFRTRLTSASSRSRGAGNQSNNSNNSHPLEKPNSLMLTSGLTTTTNNTSSTTNNSAGYRPLPQNKTEVDANPDIIPGSNGKNFSSPDYKDELQRTLSRKGIFMNTSGTAGVQENGQNNAQSNAYTSSTLPRPRPLAPPTPGLVTGGGNGIGGVGGGNGAYHSPQNHHHPASQHNQHQYQTLHHPKSNYVKDYPPPHYHHTSLPANDYNTIYIRDKLLHDSDIPESCV